MRHGANDNDGASRTDERQKGRVMSHTITLPVSEYKDLLHKTVGVTAYQRAARREEDAIAAANKAVDDVLLNACQGCLAAGRAPHSGECPF